MKLYRLVHDYRSFSGFTTAAINTSQAIRQICEYLEEQIEKETKFGTQKGKELRQDQLKEVREWYKNGFELQTKELGDVFES